MEPTKEQLAARIRDSGQVPFYTAPIAVSSLGNEMNTAGFPVAPNLTSTYNASTAGALVGAATPGVAIPPIEPTPKVEAPIETGFTALLSKYLPGGIKTTPRTSSLDTYNRLATDSNLVGTEKEVNDLTARLNEINASSTTGSLRGANCFTLSAICFIWSGVVPQQPPTIFTKPSSAHSSKKCAVCSGCSSYSPIAFGKPAFG